MIDCSSCAAICCHLSGPVCQSVGLPAGDVLGPCPGVSSRRSSSPVALDHSAAPIPEPCAGAAVTAARAAREVTDRGPPVWARGGGEGQRCGHVPPLDSLGVSAAAAAAAAAAATAAHTTGFASAIFRDNASPAELPVVVYFGIPVELWPATS